MDRHNYFDASNELAEAQRKQARHLCRILNSRDEDKQGLLTQLLNLVGSNCEVWNNFFCEFGNNISLGNNVFINANCVMLDAFPIQIGDNVAIGPNCGFYTTNHSLCPHERKKQVEYGSPIVVGNDVWIGGNVVILPGVEIGDCSVIGAGSIVTKNIPPHSLLKGTVLEARPVEAGKTSYEWSSSRGDISITQ